MSTDKNEAVWEILEETDVSPSPWFPIKKHKVKLPDHTIVDDYYITTMADAAMVVPFLKDTGHIVLVNQYKHGQRKHILELPAGFVQAGKTSAQSAIAELREETGISAIEDQLIPLGVISNIPTKATHKTYGYLATGLTFNAIQDLDITEDIEVLTKPPQEVIRMIMEGELWVGDSVSFVLKAYLLYPELFST